VSGSYQASWSPTQLSEFHKEPGTRNAAVPLLLSLHKILCRRRFALPHATVVS